MTEGANQLIKSDKWQLLSLTCDKMLRFSVHVLLRQVLMKRCYPGPVGEDICVNISPLCWGGW